MPPIPNFYLTRARLGQSWKLVISGFGAAMIPGGIFWRVAVRRRVRRTLAGRDERRGKNAGSGCRGDICAGRGGRWLFDRRKETGA